jgi:peptide/nickel transport system substrate-binding protein
MADDRQHNKAEMRTSRRAAILAAAGGGLLAGLGPISGWTPSALADASPKRGGTLKLALGGASTTDSMDPTTTQNSMGTVLNRLIYSTLVEVDATGKILPELAESWTSNLAADEWAFDLRQDATFHNGKALTAADVVYSINRNLSADSKSGAKPLLAAVKKIAANGDHRILVSLNGGNADLPYVFGDYHLGIVPAGFNDWNNPIGTGPFVMKTFDPGTRVIAARNPRYFRNHRPYVDGVEIIAVNDSGARLSALRSGNVDIINRVETRIVGLLEKDPGIKVVAAPSRTHYCFVMDTRVAPFSDNNIRLALKYAIDRKKILNNVLKGYGAIGNDQPIPEGDPFYAALPQHEYDPDKARFFLKKSGRDTLSIDLSAADGAFAGAIDMASLFAESARPAGITVNVIRESDDSYWDIIWMKKPFYMSWFGGRPTADMMLSLAYSTGSSWNDTFWSDAAFDKLLAAARVSADTAKRREMYAEMQRMIWDTGGYLIPAFANLIDAQGPKVHGLEPDINSELMAGRCGEYVWLDG